MSNVVQLKQRVREAEERVEFLESLLHSFFSGDVPKGASLDHMVLAKWGRRRLEEKKSQPALLNGSI